MSEKEFLEQVPEKINELHVKNAHANSLLQLVIVKKISLSDTKQENDLREMTFHTVSRTKNSYIILERMIDSLQAWDPSAKNLEKLINHPNSNQERPIYLELAGQAEKQDDLYFIHALISKVKARLEYSISLRVEPCAPGLSSLLEAGNPYFTDCLDYRREHSPF